MPFDIRIRLPQPYALAWDGAALEKPHGMELRCYIQKIARRQGRESAPPAEA